MDLYAAAMTASTSTARVPSGPQRGDLAARLSRAVEGDVLFDAASRGRYATDASIYQVEPVGVLVPRSADDVRAAIAICREHARAGAAARRRQLAMRADRRRRAGDRPQQASRPASAPSTATAMTVDVEPGVVLDQLNAWLKPHGLWFPVDVSTSAQATLGGMAGNNSCGSRSIAYGNMVHNVLAIDAILSDGTEARFGPEREMGGGAAARRASSCAGCARSASASATRSSATCRRCCGASAATTSTSAARRASGRTPPTAASTTRICSWAAKARSPGRANSR